MNLEKQSENFNIKGMNPTARTVAAVCIFSIAMALLESAVVVYLRALYYPDQFTVAFKLVDEKIMRVELARELSTLIMLGSVGFLAGKDFKQRLGYFLMSFAVWDIFYYGWLKIFIDWPATVFEWDILFLIPIIWLGPVLAPLLCSLTMILLSRVLIVTNKSIKPIVWTLLFSGSALILYTYMEGYASFIITNGFLRGYGAILQNENFLRLASTYIPASFNWWIFCLGAALLLAGIYFQEAKSGKA